MQMLAVIYPEMQTQNTYINDTKNNNILKSKWWLKLIEKLFHIRILEFKCIS